MNNGTNNFGTIARLKMSPVVRNNLATHADNSPEFSAVLDRCHSSLHVSFVVTTAGGAAPAKATMMHHHNASYSGHPHDDAATFHTLLPSHYTCKMPWNSN
jgi:hypothetical protein